jgi:hypothetical protein
MSVAEQQEKQSGWWFLRGLHQQVTSGKESLDSRHPRVEAGYNTSTVALWVMRGDKKGTQAQMKQ